MTLYSEKVVLRAWKREDCARLADFQNDLDVELTAGGDPPRPQLRERLEYHFDQTLRKDKRDHFFVIEADGKCIGTCGLTAPNETNRRIDLFIIIGDKEYWGKGYGRDAVRLLLDYAFRMHNYHKVALEAKADNERAIRCYRSCGFVEEGRLREHEYSNGGYVDVVVMSVLRHQWESPKP